jgi:hypothetical protein
MFDLQHRHIDSLLTWYEYHKRLGVSRVYLSIFESENELLQAGKMEGAKRFLKLPDVHYDVVPDCPRCRRDPLVCRERNNCAQAEAIEKCFLKAKRDGVRWAVFGDTDEFITLHPLEQSWADSDIEFPHNGDSGFDHKDTAEAQGALVQLLNSEFDRYSEVSLGKFVFHMEICELPPGATKLPISNLASAAPCRTKGPTCARCLPKKDKNIRHKRCHAVSTGYIILNADKVAHWFLMFQSCFALIINPRTVGMQCPQHGCDADICKGPKGGVDGRRKPILQLPMRNTAVTVHGDWKLGQSVAGTPLASVGDEQCARSHLILSTTKARMYEWQGVGSDRPDNAGKIFNNRTARLEKACIDSGGNSTVVCPPGFVRDTFMAGWAQRHQQKGGGV